MAHRLGDHLQDVFLARMQDVVAVRGAGGQEGVDATALGLPDRLGAAVDVGHAGAGQAADDALGDDAGDGADGLEVAVGGDRKARLDHVDAHFLEDLGEFQLLVMRHRGAGRLLAVAHGGVEDDDAVALGARGDGCGGAGFGYGGGHFRSLRGGFSQVGRGKRTPVRPAAKTRSLKRRPGAAKPQRKKKQAGVARAHGAASIENGPQRQASCADRALKPPCAQEPC